MHTYDHMEYHVATLQQTATDCNRLQRTATDCNRLQQTAADCHRLQQTATDCNTLEHTATHYKTYSHINPTQQSIRLVNFTHINEWYLTYGGDDNSQYTATDCQQTATDCNRLQQTAADWTDCNHTMMRRVSLMRDGSSQLNKKGKTRSLQHTTQSPQHTATHCNTCIRHCEVSCLTCEWRLFSADSFHTATHCNTLQHTVTQGNTLQHRRRVYSVRDDGSRWFLDTVQHTAIYCNTLQHTAYAGVVPDVWVTLVLREFIAYCNAELQHTAPHCTTLHHTATLGNTLQHRSHVWRVLGAYAQQIHVTLQYTAMHGKVRQHTATHAHVLQHTHTYCNILQHRSRVLCEWWLLSANSCHVVTHEKTLQQTASHCTPSHDTAQHTHSTTHTHIQHTHTYNTHTHTTHTHIQHTHTYNTHDTAQHCKTLQDTTAHAARCNNGIIYSVWVLTVICYLTVICEFIVAVCYLRIHVTRQHAARYRNAWQHTAARCHAGIMYCVWVMIVISGVMSHGNTLQDIARRCNTRQHTATHCSTQQHRNHVVRASHHHSHDSQPIRGPTQKKRCQIGRVTTHKLVFESDERAISYIWECFMSICMRTSHIHTYIWEKDKHQPTTNLKTHTHYARTHTHTYARTHTHTHTRMHIHTHTHTLTTK